ncbi:MAG: hypothetical protein HUK08_04050 [Bacteroidaceae bacterium]|nr:hypothetical protein [Bacteroidaceae bacterium]
MRFIHYILILFLPLVCMSQSDKASKELRNKKKIAEITELVQQNKLGEALNLATQMQKSSVSERDMSGVVSAYRAIVNIYWHKLDYDEAMRVINNAEDFMDSKKVPAEMYGALFYDKAIIYHYKEDYEKSLSYAEKAMNCTRNPEILAQSKNLYARTLYKLGRKDEFMKQYAELEKDPNHKKYVIPGWEQIYFLIMKGNYDKALEMANEAPDERSRIEQRMEVYEAKKDYNAMLSEAHSLYMLRSTMKREANDEGLAALHLGFHNEMLHQDSMAIAQESYRAELRKASLNRERQLTEKERNDETNSQLELLYKQNKLKKEKAVAAQKKLMEEMEAIKAQRMREDKMLKAKIVSVAVFLILLLSIIGIVGYNLIRHSKTNKELQNSMQLSKEADYLKVAFMGKLNLSLHNSLEKISNGSAVISSNSLKVSDSYRKLQIKVIILAASEMSKVLNEMLDKSKEQIQTIKQE